MGDFITAIVGTIGALGSGFAAWLFTRRKYRAEAKAIEIENELKRKSSELEYQNGYASHYQALLDDYAKRHLAALEDLERSAKTIKERDAKIDELMKTIEELTSVIKAQEAKNEDLMRIVEDLTEQLKKYKQLNGKTS